MAFKIGDRVRFLDQVGEGTILGIVDENTFSVEDETGMDWDYPASKLIAIGHRSDEHRAYNEKGVQEKEPEQRPYSIFEDRTVNHIDIHAHRLISNPEAYSKEYIIDLQLNEVRSAIRSSTQRKEKSLVIIHGEGKGALKSKVRKLLANFTEVKEVQDGSYEKFGQGATEAFFH